MDIARFGRGRAGETAASSRLDAPTVGRLQTTVLAMVGRCALAASDPRSPL